MRGIFLLWLCVCFRNAVSLWGDLNEVVDDDRWLSATADFVLMLNKGIIYAIDIA